MRLLMSTSRNFSFCQLTRAGKRTPDNNEPSTLPPKRGEVDVFHNHIRPYLLKSQQRFKGISSKLLRTARRLTSACRMVHVRDAFVRGLLEERIGLFSLAAFYRPPFMRWSLFMNGVPSAAAATHGSCHEKGSRCYVVEIRVPGAENRLSGFCSVRSTDKRAQRDSHSRVENLERRRIIIGKGRRCLHGR